MFSLHLERHLHFLTFAEKQNIQQTALPKGISNGQMNILALMKRMTVRMELICLI